MAWYMVGLVIHIINKQIKPLKTEILQGVVQTALVSKCTEKELCTKKRHKIIHRLPGLCLCLKENVVLLEFVLWIDGIFKSGFVFNL